MAMDVDIGAMVTVYSLSKDGNLYLTPNFRVKEFKCNDGSDPVYLNILIPIICQAWRNWKGKPFTPTSAYRTPTYNTKIGGVATSLHVYGNAVDIPADNPQELYEFLDKLLGDSCELGIYSWGCHVGICNDKRRFKGSGSVG